jgi:RNA polymerase sigma factor (sigma-70 family)
MDEFHAEAAPAFPSLSLDQVSNLTLESRCEMFLEHLGPDLASAVSTLRDVGGPKLSAERLAWAIAFNLDGSAAATVESNASRRTMTCYRDHWPMQTPWTQVWRSFTAPLEKSGPDHGRTLLSELALSVACEQRDDWQHPSARPINLADADRAFEFVYAQNRAKVLGLCRRLGQSAGNPEAIADEAWSRVFCNYWSTQARRRFLGLSRISTLVCQVARYAAIDAQRDEEPITTSSGDSDSEHRVLEDVGVVLDPTANMMAAQLFSRLKECMGRLPGKQRIVAEMLWFHQMAGNEVARTLRVSESAISQHLKKARDAIRACLKQQGFAVPE